jgi:hypothetical protein
MSRCWAGAVAIALGGVACEASSRTAPPAIGTPCAGVAAWCEGDDAVIDCVEGRWTEQHCSEVCAPLLHRECDGDAEQGECVCMPDSEVLHHICFDDTTLLECRGSECTELPCADVCAEAFEGWIDTGCSRDSCLCSAAGTTCPADAAPRCAGTVELYTCESGVWTANDCRVDCEPPWSGRCRTATSGEPTCTCEVEGGGG